MFNFAIAGDRAWRRKIGTPGNTAGSLASDAQSKVILQRQLAFPR